MKLGRSLAAVSVMLSSMGCTPTATRLATEQLESMRNSLVLQGPQALKISYLANGEEHSTRVIYVHGTPGDATSWSDYVLEPVGGSYSIALDRPGFGESQPKGAATRLADQAAAVAALFPTNGSKVVLVGHSLGGAVVARVAAEYPGRVQGMVLLASSLDPGQEKIHPLQPLGQMWPLNAMLPRALHNANEELMVFKAELDALEPMLPRVLAPTVIVHGTSDDLVPFANVAYMQAHLRSAACLKTVVLEGKNHFLPWNSEAVVRDAVAWALAGRCPT